MGLPNATAIAELAQPIIRPHLVGWFDITGDPVRATTAPYTVTFSGTGDTDLDTYTFKGADDNDSDPQVVDLSPVRHKESGSDTLVVTLSGIITLDSTLLTALGTRSNWQGRDARLWMMLYDEANAVVGNVWNIYTGYMSAVSIGGSPEGQTISVSVESYLASLSEPSNRTLLSQKDYDSGDLSAEKSIAIANGTSALGNAGLPTVIPDVFGQGLHYNQYEQFR